MNVAKHIASLLQFHECVIVPEFGGFISNYIPASFDEKTNTFSPPSKEVIFNGKINRNDGLLINEIVEQEKVNYKSAEISVYNFIDDINYSLNNNEKVSFEELGSFQFDQFGNVVFNPINFKNVNAYGLSSFTFEAKEKSFNNYSTKSAVRALSSRKDIIKIAASISLLLALSIFPLKNNNLKLQSSNLNPIQLLATDTPINEVIEESVLKSEDVIKKDFIIVGGSFRSQNNATQLQNSLIKKGFNSEITILENGLFKVIVDSYVTKEEAYNALKSYRSNYPNTDVWVSKR